MAPVVLNIAYPAGASFNSDYYLNKHLPPAIEAWKAVGGLLDWKVLVSVGEGSPFDAVLQVTWESAEALKKMQSGVTPEKHQELRDDVPNFSTKAPSVWVSEIKGSQ